MSRVRSRLDRRATAGPIAVSAAIALAAACGPGLTTSERPTVASTTQPTGASTGVLAAWEPKAPASVALTEVAAAVHDRRIWVAGGLDAAGRGSSSVQVYDPAADAWADGPALPEPVHHAALVATGDELLLVGGYVGSSFDTPTAAVRILAPTDDRWDDGPPLPEPRAAGAAAWDGARVVYGGGVGPNGVSDVVFELGDGVWQTFARLSMPREHLAAASDTDGRVWFLGGRSGGLDTNLAAVDLVLGDDLSDLTDLPTARGGVAAFWHQTTGACLVGGEGPEGTFAEVGCIQDDESVHALPPLAVPRHGLGAVVVDGTAYALLGGPMPGLTVSDAVEALVLTP